MLPLMMTALAALLATSSSPGAAVRPGNEAEAVQRLDVLHGRRDAPGAAAESQRIADAAVARSPSDYQVLWRAARAYFTLSDERYRSDEARSRLGKTGWDLSQRAIAARPDGVEGHYWAALCIGSFAQGMGVVRALANGIEGKFTHELERATALDPTYDHGSIPVVWAAYHLEVPWPKRDRKKARQELARALQLNPANLRARLYLARILNDENQASEARSLLAEIAGAPIGRYDAPEERVAKREAALLSASIKAP